MESVLVRPTVRGHFARHHLFVAVFFLIAFALLMGAFAGWAPVGVWASEALFGFAFAYLLFSIGLSYLHRRATSLSALQDRVEYDTGIIRHKKQKIPIRMITDSSVEKGFVDRLLGLCTIKVNTSGGIGYEVVLGLVDEKEASAFHDFLYGRIEKIGKP